MQKRHTPKQTGRRTRHSTRRNPAEESREEIIDWLRDAYAMEMGLESSLRKQADNEDLSPSIRERAGKHLEETRRHAEAVKSVLQSLDTDTSALKTTMGMMGQAAKGIGSALARDER